MCILLNVYIDSYIVQHHRISLYKYVAIYISKHIYLLYHTSNLPYTFFPVRRSPPTVQSFPMLIADWYDEDAVTMDILSPYRYVKSLLWFDEDAVTMDILSPYRYVKSLLWFDERRRYHGYLKPL